MLNINEMLTADLLKSMARAVEGAIGRTSATDDIVGDACVRILSAADSFDADRGDFRSWALRIASNTARNWRKASANNGHASTVKRGKDDAKSVDIFDAMACDVAGKDGSGSFVCPDGRADIERSSDARWLAAALDVLEADERTFIEAIGEGLGKSEAGALVGWSPATATRRYRAIIETLAAEA